jgi:hypothetical protein
MLCEQGSGVKLESRMRHTFQSSACMRTTLPKEPSIPSNLTRSRVPGGGWGGVSAYHAPKAAIVIKGNLKSDDMGESVR